MLMPNGQKFETTFWEDFTIADVFGDKAIKDTFDRAFKEWKDNLRPYLTELVIVLNMKCWQWYEAGNQKRSELYSEMYYKANEYAWDWIEEHGTEEDSNYYFEMTD